MKVVMDILVLGMLFASSYTHRVAVSSFIIPTGSLLQRSPTYGWNHDQPFNTKTTKSLTFMPSSCTKLQSSPTKKDHSSSEHFISSEETRGEKIEEKSTFWISVSKKNNQDSTNKVQLPYDPHLDMDGPLPHGSYQSFGTNDNHDEFARKPTCSITVAVDLGKSESFTTRQNDDDVLDASESVKHAQNFIDSGFTSFQIATPTSYTSLLNKNMNPKQSQSQSTETRIRTRNTRYYEQDSEYFGMEPGNKQTLTERMIYGQIIQQTPPSVISQCNFATNINIPHPNYAGGFNRGMVRDRVGNSIRNIYGNFNGCLDTIQISFRGNDYVVRTNGNGGSNKSKETLSPYTFDVFDALLDMQREGLIRSITGLNFPSDALTEMDEAGFHLDSNQHDINFVDSSRYASDVLPYYRKMNSNGSNGDGCKLKVSNPFAGGLLSQKYASLGDKYRNHFGEPQPFYMSNAEQKYYDKVIKQSWAKLHPRDKRMKRSNGNLWYRFENIALQTMTDIAYKHQVSISCVALRWCMHLESFSSVIVPSSLSCANDGLSFHDHKDLRETFTFELDEQDLEQLWDVSGGPPPEPEPFDWSQGESNDLGMPFNMNDTKLWL